jgi:FAD/FMN-containing dehydrogenase
LAVVRPGTTQEVAAVVRHCQSAGVPIVPQGGNTGLVGGSIPDASGSSIVLSLQRLHKVRHIDHRSLSVTVEAGCVLQTLQQTVAAAGYLFPLSLAAQGSCTIGGNLATNAGGTQVLRFGNTRELCLGLEVVTPQAQIWDGLSGLRKDNTGYDLRDLYIGSEGTLGIITAATLKLFPCPAAQFTAWITLSSMDQAVELLGMAQKALGPSLTGFEAMNDYSVMLVARHFPQMRMPFPLGQEGRHFVLLDACDWIGAEHARSQIEGLLEKSLELGVIADAVLAENMDQARQLWEIRESIPLAGFKEGAWIAHDIALPVSAIPGFSLAITQALQAQFPGVRVCNFGHLGDGNLHLNVHAPAGVAPAPFIQDFEPAIRDAVYQSVAQEGGSFSAEHGIGAIKKQHLLQFKSPVAVSAMRSIKAALDPLNLFNPGRVLEPPSLH